ncbi:asparagine--tRNA ligase [bacterium]|nr:asparagine--tRNA ligase [bacterium]MCI0601399.1 asparagine--tRNA ligase [bacterium]
MKQVYIDRISRHEGEEITIKGWLHNKRSSGKIQFLIIRDGTGYIQGVVVANTVSPDLFQQFDRITQESALIVHGKVRADKRAPSGYELDVTSYEIVSIAEEYPITPKEHGVAFLMEKRHLWLRSTRQHAILRIRDEIIRACRDFYHQEGFTLVDAPIFTPAACEGTTTLFETQYFDEGKAYLTQSGQLYSEATAMALGKVYCFGPTFRAEKSKTRRHLTEFWMIEPEVAFAELHDIMELAERFISFIVQRVLENRKIELKTLERDITKLESIQPPFPRLSYDEAAKFLKDKGLPFEYGSDFGGTDETVLSENYDRPVMVHRYPAATKAFYMQPDPENPRLALCVDVLAPEGYGEIIGGSQRIHDYNLLLQRIKEHHLPQEAFEWYLDLRRYGTVPHSGFGMGIERVVAWICKLEHVRETIPFPRMLYRIYP